MGSVFNLTETQPETRVFSINLTRNFETQTQPKPEFENLTKPKKPGLFWVVFQGKFLKF
jgi:hypothetical protein